MAVQTQTQTPTQTVTNTKKSRFAVTLAKPKAILFDISGTATKTSFIERVLIPYTRTTIKPYVEDMWNSATLQQDIARLRKHQQNDAKSGLNAPPIAGPNEDVALQQKSVCDHVIWHIDNKQDSHRAVRLFKFNMWFDAYDKDKLKTHVYSDVAIQLRRWKSQHIALYVISNGWSQITKKFMTKTTHGNLECIIDGFFDPSIGPFTQSSTYHKVLNSISMSAANVVFLTKDVEEAKAAKEAGITPVLVLTHRKNFNRLSEQDKSGFPIVRTFLDINFQ